jgi:hypothetical protein
MEGLWLVPGGAAAAGVASAAAAAAAKPPGVRLCVYVCKAFLCDPFFNPLQRMRVPDVIVTHHLNAIVCM